MKKVALILCLVVILGASNTFVKEDLVDMPEIFSTTTIKVG